MVSLTDVMEGFYRVLMHICKQMVLLPTLTIPISHKVQAYREIVPKTMDLLR
jgi:hypothetical protein